MPRINEYKTFDSVDSAIAHANELAAQLGRNRSVQEVRGRAVRVTDEDGKEVHRASLSSSTFTTS
jgi:hypothetical protein